MSKCRSCEAPVEWAEWEDGGKAVPLDPGPVANGNLVVINGKVRRYTHEDEKLGRERRVTHFATCPNAADWRQRR